MDMGLDLDTASREALLAVIAELLGSNAQLQQQVAALEARLNTRGSSGMPGNNHPQAGKHQEKRPAKGDPMASPGYGWRQPTGWSTPWRPVQSVGPG